jgi:hypothetical protein
MASKIDTLVKILVAKNSDAFTTGYANACGSIKSLANMMMEDLPADKRAFYERVIDGLIADNS